MELLLVRIRQYPEATFTSHMDRLRFKHISHPQLLVARSVPDVDLCCFGITK